MANRASDDTAMKRFHPLATLVATLISLMGQPAWSTTGGTTGPGPMVLGTDDHNGSREWVDLVETGDLLVGRPKNGSIELIMVQAPEASSGSLILRELNLPEKGRLLHLSAPASLAEKARRVTIFVRDPSKNLVLLEWVEGQWKEREPQPVPIASEEFLLRREGQLLAFSVSGFGSYWLVPDALVGPVIAESEGPDGWPSRLFGGGIVRAFSTWIWALVLLAIGWILSGWTHRMERRNGE